MKALVFAAGLGTRLGEITKEIPKALVPVGGVPMLERVLGKLSAAGFGEAVVTVCYKADRIREWLASGPVPGIEVSLSIEPGPEPFETGGGIKFARPLLDDGRPFLAHNVDILSDADLAEFVNSGLDALLPTGALAALLVTNPRPEDDRFFLFDPADMRLRGWANTRTGEVRGCVKGAEGAPADAPDASDLRRMSFCGIHLISPAIFPLMEDWPERFSITDLYIAEAARRPIYGIPAPEGFRIIDIGSPETLAEAELTIPRTRP